MTTDSAGRYAAISVPVGPYQVSASKAGFESQVKTRITLVVGQSSHVAGSDSVRAEFFNILNHANFSTPNAMVFSSASATTAPTAGVITGTPTTSRQIQFGLKLLFGRKSHRNVQVIELIGIACSFLVIRLQKV